MTSSARDAAKAEQQRKAQAQALYSADPLRAELNEAAVEAGIRVGSMWLQTGEAVTRPLSAPEPLATQTQERLRSANAGAIQ